MSGEDTFPLKTGLSFAPLSPENSELFNKYAALCGVKGADSCFTTQWALESGVTASFEAAGSLCWLATGSGELLAPVGDWSFAAAPGVLEARFGKKLSLKAVPETFAQLLEKELAGRAEVTAELYDRGRWEYLYSLKELAELPGGKFVKKRGRINRFKKDYSYTATPLDGALAAELMAFQESWYRVNSYEAGPGLEKEHRAILRILENWDKITGLCGTVIKIKGETVAYTIGEAQEDTLVVQFEKASLEYGAGYQVVNMEFCRQIQRQFPEITTVNREEDLNDAGLREAKLSYMPTAFNRLCSVNIEFM